MNLAELVSPFREPKREKLRSANKILILYTLLKKLPQISRDSSI